MAAGQELFQALPGGRDLTTRPLETAPPSEDGRADEARLRVVQSPDLAAVGRCVVLPRWDELTVGRAADQPQALLLDLRLSRAHASVSFDRSAGRFRISDCRSRNGTFVNGRQIETALLEPDAVIRLGDSLLVFEQSDEMGQLRERVAELAGSARSVLILGETGSGKELFARQLHDQSRRSGAFVAVNCAALSGQMIAAELFGHAEGGTLLLDEISEMPLDLQPTLLRLLQEKRVRPPGSDTELDVDVRVLAATASNRDLDAKLASGQFRHDLYARLAEASLRIPALRARRGELLALARQLAASHGHKLDLSADSAEALLLWLWPLNFRELDALIGSLPTIADEVRRVDLAQLRQLKPELTELLRSLPANEPGEAAASEE